MVSSDEVKRELKALGNTLNEVYNKVKASGVKGRRCSACNCPIAALLRRMLGEVVYVRGGHVILGMYQRRCTYVPIPAPVSEFMSNFDLGCLMEFEEQLDVT